MGITACGLIILAAISGGLPEISWLGNDGMTGSAAAAGMGRTWYADPSPHGALENPSVSSMLAEGFTAGLTGQTVLDIEKRTRRVYDTFGGLVGESEHSFNQNFFPLPGGAVLGWKQGSFSAAAGWRAVSTFHYDYSRVVNDNNYLQVARETLEVRGMLNDFGVSAGYSLTPLVALGLGGSFITGSRSSDYAVRYVDPYTQDIEVETETDISGMRIRGSALVDLGRLYVSAGASQPVDWKAETGQNEMELTLPVTVFTGLSYTPGNRLKSVFRASFDWSGTSSVEVDGTDQGLRNTWGFAAGSENTLPGNTIVRLGLDYRTSPVSSSLDRMGFTAGMGWIVADVAVDAAVGFSPSRWDQYSADGLPTFVYGDSLVIQSSRTEFSLGVSKSF